MDKIGNSNFKPNNTKFPGIYRGLVVDNNDPQQLGRVKVKIYPMLAEVATDSLPWAVPMYPIVEGAGSGIGYFAVPDINTMVYILFEQGDIYQPVYIGEAPDGAHGTPSERVTNYSNRKVLKTSSGIVIYIDDTAKKLKVETAGGIYFEIDDTLKTIDIKHPVVARFFVDSGGNITLTGTTLNLNPV